MRCLALAAAAAGLARAQTEQPGCGGSRPAPLCTVDVDIQWMEAQGGTVDTRSAAKGTLLMGAATGGQEAMTQMLLPTGAGHRG